MNKKIVNLLNGKSENHIMPFLWMHGEDEETIRNYVRVVKKANCHAVCVESRPHPDFCGPGWWNDLGIVLDEARNLGMKVWILDDSHFPTGYANGALKDKPAKLHRQFIYSKSFVTKYEQEKIEFDLTKIMKPEFIPNNMLEKYVLSEQIDSFQHFDDDAILSVIAVSRDGKETISIAFSVEGKMEWTKPVGEYTIWIIGKTRNLGPHREYINMLDRDSCRILIDTVYESHYAHFKEYFGNTIAGFFSDEPELGNGHLYCHDQSIGSDIDLPYSDELERRLNDKLHHKWLDMAYMLWDNMSDKEITAKIRYVYMDQMTSLVSETFSKQVGDWCYEHGVQYIGHLIEDNNAHARTGSSLGHYFRGLWGQDMAGIDDIGGQVLPQGENEPYYGKYGVKRDGEFYHFQLGNLAASAAAIDPKKNGNAMCEIFGNYGWQDPRAVVIKNGVYVTP